MRGQKHERIGAGHHVPANIVGDVAQIARPRFIWNLFVAAAYQSQRETIRVSRRVSARVTNQPIEPFLAAVAPREEQVTAAGSDDRTAGLPVAWSCRINQCADDTGIGM